MKHVVLLTIVFAAACLKAVTASCESGFCDAMPNSDFGLGQVYFERNHDVEKSHDATLEVIPGTPQHDIETLGAKVATNKNILLMAADYGTQASFSIKYFTVPSGANVALKFNVLIPLANPDAFCQIISRKGTVHHKVLLKDLKVGEWVSYSSPVVVPATDRTIKLQCQLKAVDSSDHSILFDFLNLCVSYPPGKGLSIGNANYNLLYSNLAANQATGWSTTSGVEWKAGDKGMHQAIFKKSTSEEVLSRIFTTYPHRAYSLSGILNKDLDYMPLKIYINSVRVSPLFRAAGWDITAQGTQFYVMISNPSAKLNITIVKDRRETCEHIVRNLGIYAHGCVAQKAETAGGA